jgi:hypothetical protein
MVPGICLSYLRTAIRTGATGIAIANIAIPDIQLNALIFCRPLKSGMV